MKCKYWDCGWCYAPENVKTNATQGGCFEPEYCPYTKQMTEEQLLNSLQGTMATIDPYSVKKEAIDEYRIDTIEERLTRIEDKVDLLISQLKIEFYKKNDGTSR